MDTSFYLVKFKGNFFQYFLGSRLKFEKCFVIQMFYYFDYAFMFFQTFSLFGTRMDCSPLLRFFCSVVWPTFTISLSIFSLFQLCFLGQISVSFL